ncbi:MAG: hypothetical protein HDR17_07370 [Lachnospiraceae bacterium]|nr:hypothetical protein [Lachnospiraceae bacterium]MBD5503375.1 hypothetical protein [Lachnospiraceae bacterium]MBD5506296.1 hypothetical protein [Lachnospiraceae bacterium]
MTNVRDYLKKKKERETEKPRVSYRERIKSHKFTIFYRSILVLVLIAAVIAALYIQWSNKIYTQAAEVSSVEINITQGSQLLPFAGYLLTYSKDGAGCMDIKGNAVWNQTFEMQNPIVDICQNVVAIGDYNGRNIYVMNTSGVMGSITTNKPMRDFCVAANGVVAAVLDDTDTTWIYLYDSQGKEKELAYFRTTMKDSGYPVKVAISPSGELVCVSYLFVDSGQMKSSVAFYNFGAVGQNNTNNYVSGYDYLDTVVPFVRFLDNRSLFAVADNRVMLYGGAQKPVSVLENLIDDSVQSVYYGGEYVGLVFNSTEEGSRYRLDVYHKSGVLKQSINFNIEYSDIIFYEDQIIIYNEAECCIYNSNGMEKYNGRFNKSTLVLIPQNAAYRYMAVTPDSIDTIELQ